MKLRVLLVLLMSSVAYASTGAVTLDNKSSDVVTMYVGDLDHSCIPSMLLVE